MTENFLFKALFISLSVHTAILWAFYFQRIQDHAYNSPQDKVEINYVPMYKRVVDIKEHPIRPSQRLDLSNDQKLFDDGTVPVSLGSDRESLPFGMLDEARPQRMQVMELSHRITIRPVTSAKINNPIYSAYNDMVRERIKEKVYENYDKMERGTVYLTFLVDHNGILTEAQIIPEKTDASDHLQEMALKSLREASPFPAFLKGMTLWEYPFNIEIQYQVSDD